ncbi:MAG: hypothetical protein M3R37_10705 [Actinomycetota bacterium]|nr:hypothetical protein [Actinomycetota bacterium]
MTGTRATIALLRGREQTAISWAPDGRAVAYGDVPGPIRLTVAARHHHDTILRRVIPPLHCGIGPRSSVDRAAVS